MNSTIIKIKLVAILTLIITGCTNPMNTKITKENYDEVVKSVRAKSSSEEVKKMEAVLFMAKIGTLSGKTESFNEIIKNLNAKKDKQQEQQKRNVAQSAKLTDFFKISGWKKESIQGRFEFDRKIRISFVITSKLDKEVGALEGAIFIFDKLDNELANIPIKMTSQNIKPADIVDLSSDFSIMDFGKNGDEVFNAQTQNLRFLFLVNRVRLADGTDL